ncbi:MAG TPA: NAD(P)H-hydrate epimerase [Candidatus Dormibacteraeota bacterium]|nr:NAD(P)H-hydrate epimerase [Candidatus Dormibacteraeota bacterium]
MSSSDPPRTLTSAQVRELDRLASERFGIALDWLMEAAGWQAARMCEARTAVVCGVGNNAGDGLAAARHLHRWGRLASVSCVDRSRLGGRHAARELAALEAIGVTVGDRPALAGADVVLDGIFGTGLNRAPEGRFAEWIEAINASGLRVVAIDVPSGLDADSGVAYAPTVHADATITFTLPKSGLLKADGPRVAGDVTVADIGIPNEALRLVLG